MARAETVDENVQKVLRYFGDCKSYHDRFVDKIIESERAYHGIIKKASDANRWKSKLHPPWINHIVETTLASLVEEKLAFQIRPAARFFEEGEYERAEQGARGHEMLLTQQLVQDRFQEKQRPVAMQALITGIGVTKDYWRREIVPKRRLQMQTEFVDGYMVPVLKEVEYPGLSYNGPCTEVINVEDFFWHEAATSPDRCRYFIHRCYYSTEEMKMLGKRGIYKNVDDAIDPEGDGANRQGEPPSHPREYEYRERTKDMHECLECWDNELHLVTTVCGKTLLRHEKFPFFHGRHPFTIFALQPYPFQIDAPSIVSKLVHLQEALWDVMNQRHDNLKLLNNLITAVGPMVDLDALVYEPGARWPVEDVNQILPIKVDPLPAQISLPAEAMLKQDIQNLAGGQPFTSTSEARSVGADTATEAALVTSLAQLATKRMKENFFYGFGRVGQNKLELNQQFIRMPVYVERLGIDSNVEVTEILPEMLQGEFLFDITPLAESLMRQERRAEANTFLTLMVQAAPVLAATGVPMNFKAIMEYVLKTYGMDGIDRFFSAMPQPGMVGDVTSANKAQQAQTPGVGPMGVTAQQSIDPAMSPSNQASISPETMLQRNFAFQGGAMNNGGG